MADNLPIHQGIDRSVPYPAFLVRQSVYDGTGKLVAVLETEVGGSYGPMTDDPAPFPRLPAFASCGAFLGGW